MWEILGRDVMAKLVLVNEILLNSNPFILFKHNALVGFETAGILFIVL